MKCACHADFARSREGNGSPMPKEVDGRSDKKRRASRPFSKTRKRKRPSRLPGKRPGIGHPERNILLCLYTTTNTGCMSILVALLGRVDLQSILTWASFLVEKGAFFMDFSVLNDHISPKPTTQAVSRSGSVLIFGIPSEGRPA